MKHFLTSALGCLAMVLAGCGSSRAPLSEAEWQHMEAVVTQRDFKFVGRWAEPLQTGSLTQVTNAGLVPPGSSVNRIDLTGTANYLKMQGEEVQAQLPYFGERQVIQTYGRTEGIEFEGTAMNIRTRRDEKKNYYDLDFDLKKQTELLQCNLRLYANNRALLTIYSNQRHMIRYEGIVQKE